MTAVHLTIIAKSPVPGRVKTRLCPPCTPETRRRIAAAALADTIDAIDDVVASPRRRPAHVRRDAPRRCGPAVDPADYAVVAQRGDGLRRGWPTGSTSSAPGVIIGMDTPSAARGLADALLAVAAGRDALGLAVDGGYWAIGLTEPDQRIFEGIPMSRSDTGLAQLRRLHGLGRPVRLLSMARDLDDEADLRAHAAAGAPGRLAAVAACDRRATRGPRHGAEGALEPLS